MQQHGIAVGNGSNDSLDVKYVEEYGKFLAICTDSRLSPDSYLAFYESNDGIHFERVDVVKKNVFHYCHNSGMAGSKNGHIVKGMPTFAAYAYGPDWGVWNTRVQDFTLSLTDKIDLSEINEQNIKANTERDTRDPDTLDFVAISPRNHDVMYVSSRSHSVKLELYACTTFQNKWQDLRNYAEEIKLYGYDENVVKAKEGSLVLTVVGEGSTVVTAEWRGMITQICIKVYDRKTAADAVTGLVPFVTDTYRLDHTDPLSFNPQIKSIISYDNATWIEAWGAEHGITYEYDSSKIRVTNDGVVYPVVSGTHEVKVKCAGFSYVAKVTVVAPEKPFSYESIDFTDAQASRVIASLSNASYKMTDEGLVCIADTGEDPLMYLNYVAGAIDTAKYKSITLTYKLEPGVSQTRGQLFFMTGANPNPAEAASQKYVMVADGQWRTVTINLAGKPYWSGMLSQIRFDFFDGCKAGESLLVQSITLDPVE